jgi:hypothetical protein
LKNNQSENRGHVNKDYSYYADEESKHELLEKRLSNSFFDEKLAVESRKIIDLKIRDENRIHHNNMMATNEKMGYMGQFFKQEGFEKQVNIIIRNREFIKCLGHFKRTSQPF